MSKQRTIADLQPGTKALVTEFLSDESKSNLLFLQRLMQMGLTAGTEIELAHLAPFGGAVAVRLRGTLIALRLSDAAKIKVEKI